MRLLFGLIGTVLLISCSTRDAELFNEDRYREHIKVLASDEFEGRAPASAGEVKTINYLSEQFAALGIPGANNGSYTQGVPLTSLEVTNKPVLKIHGQGEHAEYAYQQDFMVASFQQQARIGLDSELVFVGYGINAPERNWNDYEGLDVKGKTVIVLVNDPGFATQDPAIFNGNAMTYYGRWTYKYEEAARQGAAAAIIVHETAPASYPWSVVTGSWSGKQFDIQREDGGKNLLKAEAWINIDTAQQVFGMAGMDFNKLKLAAQQPGFRAVNLNLRAQTELEMAIEHTASNNIAAYIEGSEKPDEVFIFTAHWDHLGVNPQLEGDQIYNGAIDNATGTAALLELAAAYKNDKTPPKRSVLFLAVTAEEQGLLGSNYYAEFPLFPIEKTVAGLNMDALRAIGPVKDVVVMGYGFSDLDNYLKDAAVQLDREILPDDKPQNGYYFRSDHFELAKKGVPMIYARGGINHLEKGPEYGKEMSQAYSENEYHQVSDEYREDWDLRGALRDLELYYRTSRLIVDGDNWPAWSEGSEFKKLRP